MLRVRRDPIGIMFIAGVVAFVLMFADPANRAFYNLCFRWMLDTWYSFRGAMNRKGMTDCCLDGAQTIIGGHHFG